VPGDIIRIRAGDFIPVDVELLKGEELEIDQSALKGGVPSCFIENRR